MRTLGVCLLLLLLMAVPVSALTFTEIGVERYLGSDGETYTLGQALALGWPEMLAFWRPALEIHNLGIGGNTSAQMLARFGEALATGAQAITIGPCCWNDAAAGVPPATTAANVRAMILQAQAAGRHVALVEVPPGGQGVDLTAQRGALLAVAVETCARSVPVWSALNNPDAPGSMLGTLRAEGVHPNGEGLRRIAERVAHSLGW